MSMVVVRVGAAALVLTGLSHDAARFQALSAFTGTGFTTSESESVVSHPVRRRILTVLMVLGNAGIVSMLGTLILSFTTSGGHRQSLNRLSWIVAGLLILWLVSRSRWLDRQMGRLILRALRRWTKLEVRDFEDLLRLSHGYGIMEMFVKPSDWVAGKTLAELRLSHEGINVIALRRADGTYVGTPTGQTRIMAGDVLILYGRRERFAELDSRPSGGEGDARHASAVQDQRRIMRSEDGVSQDPDMAEGSGPS